MIGFLKSIPLLTLSFLLRGVLSKIVLIINGERQNDSKILAFAYKTLYFIDKILVQPSIVLLLLSGAIMALILGITLENLTIPLLAQMTIGLYLIATDYTFILTARKLRDLTELSANLVILDPEVELLSRIPQILDRSITYLL